MALSDPGVPCDHGTTATPDRLLQAYEDIPTADPRTLRRCDPVPLARSNCAKSHSWILDD
jgi:hypothetical protein